MLWHIYYYNAYSRNVASVFVFRRAYGRFEKHGLPLLNLAGLDVTVVRVMFFALLLCICCWLGSGMEGSGLWGIAREIFLDCGTKRKLCALP